MSSVVNEELNKQLAKVYSLSLAAKQAHWNVKGVDFLDMHEQLDAVATELRAIADEIAERISTLNGVPNAMPEALAAATYPSDLPIKKLGTQEVASLFDKYLDETVHALEKAAHVVGEADLVTQDILIESARTLAKSQWFFASHKQP